MFRYNNLFKQLLKLFTYLTILSLNNHLFADEPKKLRIGYQPYGTLILVKGRGQLANKLANLDVTVEWVEFKTGISMLDAFGQGQLYCQRSQFEFSYSHACPSDAQERCSMSSHAGAWELEN